MKLVENIKNYIASQKEKRLVDKFYREYKNGQAFFETPHTIFNNLNEKDEDILAQYVVKNISIQLHNLKNLPTHFLSKIYEQGFKVSIFPHGNLQFFDYKNEQEKEKINIIVKNEGLNTILSSENDHRYPFLLLSVHEFFLLCKNYLVKYKDLAFDELTVNGNIPYVDKLNSTISKLDEKKILNFLLDLNIQNTEWFQMVNGEFPDYLFQQEWVKTLSFVLKGTEKNFENSAHIINLSMEDLYLSKISNQQTNIRKTKTL